MVAKQPRARTSSLPPSHKWPKTLHGCILFVSLVRSGYLPKEPGLGKKDWMAVLGTLGFWVFGIAAMCGLLRRFNCWFYERKLGLEQKRSLPPGDMGWPLIGKMWSFLRAFKSGNPDAFIGAFVRRFGRTGVYKTFMFGSPTILVTAPETCKQVLMDDRSFIPGWPTSTCELIGKKSFVGIYHDKHKRLRRMTAAPVSGCEALSVYLQFIDDVVVSTLEKWSNMGEIEFLTEVRRLTFKIIMHIFLGMEDDSVVNRLEKAYTDLNYGMRAMAINLPGFAYYKALKARKRLVAVLQWVIDERRASNEGGSNRMEKDMMENLMEAEDENGTRLSDEEIIDILIMYLNAGHESSGHITMWATILLQKHPEFLKKAKEEQIEIRRSMPTTQKGLTLKEVRKMEYLYKVIDETLRVVNISFVAFRRALADVTVNGYTIPKGWRVQLWYRNVHMDPEVYPNPKDFNPSRWGGLVQIAGAYLPFGGGNRLCPGSELAKLEISVFLHHFLLGYELFRLNPNCAIQYLPHPRPVDNCRAEVRRVVT